MRGGHSRIERTSIVRSDSSANWTTHEASDYQEHEGIYRRELESEEQVDFNDSNSRPSYTPLSRRHPSLARRAPQIRHIEDRPFEP